MGVYQPVIAEGQYFNSICQASDKLHICHKYIKRRCKSDLYPNYYFTEYQIPEEQLCSTCKNMKSLSEFYNNKNTRNKKSTDCKECSSKSSIKNKQNNKAFYKDYHLKRIYNLSLDQYNVLFENQKGCCVICGTHQSNLKKSLVVDHDHNTGEVRGLLCATCNLGIGCLKDDITLLSSAIVYLNNYNK